MDVFFDTCGRPAGRPSSGGGHVEREGIVVKLTAQSVLFFDDEAGQEFFVPVSTILDWWFTANGTKRTRDLEELEPDDEITLLMPRWLLKKEGLL